MDKVLRAGTARVDITPPLTIPYLGYEPRHAFFRGVHDPLYARALAVDDGQTQVVLIARFANGAIGKVASSIENKMPCVFNIQLLGDKGSIRNNQIYAKSKFPGQTDFVTIPTILPDSGDVTHHPFEAEIDHLVDCILNDVESHANVEDTYKTHEVCLAADLSAMEGRPVRLPLA